MRVWETVEFWVGVILAFPTGAASGLIWGMFNRRKLNRMRAEVRDELKGV